MTDERLELVQPAGAPGLALVGMLFREYQQSLQLDLSFQDFEQELAALPGDYAPPLGRLYLGRVQDEPVCCVALRPLDAATGEMKRLYVRPAFRGRSYGLHLADTVIRDAQTIGYERLVLDTLPTMAAAQRMYDALGFRDIPPYTFNPVAGTRFMALTL